VIEADEYDRMFLGLDLETAVITNVEWDHVDCYPSPKIFIDAFRTFVAKLREHGHLILNADDPAALSLHDAVTEGVLVETYGLTPDADWHASDLTPNGSGGLNAAVWHEGQRVAELSLAIPGRYNVRNALAALVVADWFGIPAQRAAIALRDFHGTGRRFEVIGEANGVTIIDDYAHHPTEVSTVLAAARLRFGSRRIWVVFQPHTYSRTKALLGAFARSFDDADRVLLLDIYPAREKLDLGMHSKLLLEQMHHPGAEYVGSIEEAHAHLVSHVQAEDVVITMSAGDGNKVGQMLLASLRG
jgi:UDP-N-acetylmuramate--alanine ligase